MGSLFKARTADEIEDNLLKFVEKYKKAIEKEGLNENLVGLNGLLFIERTKEKMNSLGVNVSSKDLGLLKNSIANKQNDRMDQIILGISQKSGLPNSEHAGRFKQEKLGAKGELDIFDGSSVLTALTNAPAAAIPLVLGYAAYKGIAALVSKVSDMRFKANINKEVLALPIIEGKTMRSKNTI